MDESSSSRDAKQADNVDFGFENIAMDAKTPRVRSLFSGVASKYDVMNDAMSMGLHRLWKKKFVANLRLKSGMQVLDMAGGTGDITAEILRKSPSASICVADLCDDMLRHGRQKLRESFPPGSRATAPTFHCADAQRLPYADNSFDLYTIAFGIRNVADKEKALSEAYRTLKPGGAFACLEFSDVQHPLLAKMYKAYSFGCIPLIGKALADNKDAYRYLVESIAMFPRATEFADMITAAGFVKTRYDRLNGGVVCIHSAVK